MVSPSMAAMFPAAGEVAGAGAAGAGAAGAGMGAMGILRSLGMAAMTGARAHPYVAAASAIWLLSQLMGGGGSSEPKPQLPANAGEGMDGAGLAAVMNMAEGKGGNTTKQLQQAYLMQALAAMQARANENEMNASGMPSQPSGSVAYLP